MDGLDTRDSHMPQMTQSDDEDVDDEDFGTIQAKKRMNKKCD